MSKKTIYQYYADKDELVVAVVSEVILHNQACCDADRQSADNAVHEIFLAIDMMTEIFRTMNKSILFDMQKYHPAAFDKFLKHKNEFMYKVVYENLEKVLGKSFTARRSISGCCRYRVECMMIAFNPAFSESVGLKLAEIQQELTFTSARACQCKRA